MLSETAIVAVFPKTVISASVRPVSRSVDPLASVSVQSAISPEPVMFSVNVSVTVSMNPLKLASSEFAAYMTGAAPSASVMQALLQSAI